MLILWNKIKGSEKQEIWDSKGDPHGLNPHIAYQQYSYPITGVSYQYQEQETIT